MLSPWLYLFQLNNIKIILKNHQVTYMNFIWSSYYWIISGLSFHCYTSLEMLPKNFLNSSYGDKNEFKQERIKLPLGWSSGWKNRLSKVADFENARNFHVKLKNFFSLQPLSDRKKKHPKDKSSFHQPRKTVCLRWSFALSFFLKDFSRFNLESKGTSAPLQLFKW